MSNIHNPQSDVEYFKNHTDIEDVEDEDDFAGNDEFITES